MAKKTLDTESATTQVNIADFQRTRDSVIVALATLQSSVQDLSRAYIQHANTVLTPGKHGLNPIDANLTSILTESGLLAGPRTEPAPAAAEPEGDGKKKRKRTPHDPNAPKRALTPYFLYMQSARATIAKELGDSAKPKEVADEGTRRWTEMSPAEKSVWDDKYQKNLAAYRVKMAAYKAGQPVPSDEQATHLVNIGKAPEHVAGIDAEAETEEEVAAVESDTPEPVKEVAPPKSKRRKTKDAEATPNKAAPKVEIPAKSPEKKGKKSKKEKEAVPAPAPPSASKPEKTRKSKK